MQADMHTCRVVTATNLAEFFRDALHGALADQRLEVDERTERYVVDMLTLFARAERLYQANADRPLKPLALMLADALEATSVAGRELALQRLGDISLFMAGLFARGFSRRLVDVDYHIAIGGRAYGALARSHERRRRLEPARVFAELAAKFQREDMIKRFLSSGYSGFYFSVDEEGEVGAGDEFQFLTGEIPSLTIAEFNHLYTSPDPELDLLKRAVEVKSLPESWRERFHARMEVVSEKRRI